MTNAVCHRYKHLGYSYNQNEKVEKMHSFEICIDFSSKILHDSSGSL